jgi:nuclear GTP-binding protein
MVKKKGKSKRTTLKDKYKIQKRTVQTHRKNRKQAKKDAASGVVQHKKKDPGIPNSWPFKADLLKEIQRTRERQQALQQTKKEQRADQLRALRQHQAEGGTARTVEELAQMADQMRQEYDAATSAAAMAGSGGAAASSKDSIDGGGKAANNSAALGQQSRRAYLRELKKVVEASDVLLQVLDARDPVGTRLGAMAEDAILSHSDKRMVLVLNKIDLVPKEVVGAWLTHLRKSHPTIALQANKVASSKGKGINSANGENDDDDNATMATSGTTSNSTSSSSLTSGMDGLLQLLKNYARTSGGGKNSKTNIVVGVGTSQKRALYLRCHRCKHRCIHHSPTHLMIFLFTFSGLPVRVP